MSQTVAVEFVCRESEKEIWAAGLWEHGCTGVVETDAGPGRVALRAFFDSAEVPAAVLELLAGLETSLTEIEPADWVADSRRNWSSFCVGERFFLVPDWSGEPAPEGRLRLSFNPGLAFGTGFHEATQQCLEALEKYLRPGMRVVDVGCGSGILSIAAKLLGAGRTVGCDPDPEAVAVARERSAELEVFQGSATALGAGIADLILCNINAAADGGLAPDCLRALAPGGVCVAAGFEIYEEKSVEAELVRAGASIVERRRKHIWSCFVYGNAPKPFL